MDNNFRRSKQKRRRTAKFFTILGFGLLNLTNSGVRCFAIGRNDNSQQPQHHLNPTSSKRRRQDSNNNKNNNLYRSQSLANLNSIAKQNGNIESHTDKHSYCYTNGRLQATQSDDDNHIDQIANIGNNVTAVSEDTQKDQRQLKESLWPCMDKLDRELIKISLPVIGNFAIGPLIGAVDLFWVNRMGDALAVAGQSAANQVFSSAFWFVSFLPSVTATLVAKQHAKGDKEATQDAICQALFVGFFIAMIGTPAMFFFSEGALSSVLQKGAPAMKYAKPYLLIRAFAFLPSLISLVGFSAFRGILDTKTPVKISAFANIFNAVLDPILIFSLAMGVPGAALATLAAEVISAVVYLVLLRKRQLISWVKLFRPPSWASLQPLLQGGLALQLRNLSLNLTFLAVARVTQSIDQSGVAAAAHAMAIQTFQIGGIVLLAVSTVAQIMVPNAMVERYDEASKKTIGGLRSAKATSNRLMSWGFVLGCALGSLQLLLLPVMFKTTPLQEVRDAAKLPAIIASILQIINGLVFIGEGIMIGTGSFLQLSISTVIATAGCLWALWFFPPRVGLTGVWLGFGVFNMLRLVGVYIHQRINGPLSWRKIEQAYASN
jgi:MATE family multidrug resistance protein